VSKSNGGNIMDFQTILAIAIIAGVIYFVAKKRKDKKPSGGGSGGGKGGGGSISKYKNTQRK
jgi:hypothetical protein|tara:strand:- start:3621 stop:3806 length:186 start_codon:yes stop_codon:yes gene_type:complete